MKVKIYHWEFHNGVDPINPGSKWPMVPNRGWTCWAYPSNDHKFERWMKENCPTAEATHRFNGGDPMYTVSISDDKEATIFQLKWC